MDFQESEKYLYSLGNEVETMKLGLENIRALLAEMGEPQTNYLKVQVAGTNGKGSVCAFLDSICRQADIRTGLYTSPHLVSITERIKIDGVDISEDDFARLATKVRDAAEGLVAEGKLSYTPTYFEQVTAIGLLAFAEAKVELAILETGLGGRLDATTAANAEIAAITRIDLDHKEYLGDTIEEIAAEKAAIIRPGSSAVLCHQSKPVERVLTGRCHEAGVDPVWASTDIRVKNEPELAPVLFGSITTKKAHYGFLELSNMLGRHQFENAAVAIGIAEALIEHGLDISTDEIAIGINIAKHPGRLEWIAPNFVLDGAHNPGGAKALRAYLDEFEHRPITMVFGAMGDKDVREIANVLWPLAEHIILTRSANTRSMDADELRTFSPVGLTDDRLISTANIADALRAARQVSRRDGIVLISGSLYLVGEVRKLLTRIEEGD